MGDGPLPLPYEDPPEQVPFRILGMDTGWFTIRVLRRLMFMAGMGVLFAGLGEALGRESAAGMMVFGAAMLGACIPLGRLPGEPRR
jgi:hypothetical protein